MDEKQFATWVMALKTYYPDPRLLPSNKAIELWYMQLKDIDYKLAEAALNKWVAVKAWPPKISDIRQQAYEIAAGENPDWGEGWNKLQEAIRYYGAYREAEAYDHMDEITRTVVKRLGFKNLCYSENVTADRANFRDMFVEVAARQQTQNLLSKDLRLQISAYRQQAIEQKGEPYGQEYRAVY
jgi:hypothetical protein